MSNVQSHADNACHARPDTMHTQHKHQPYEASASTAVAAAPCSCAAISWAACRSASRLMAPSAPPLPPSMRRRRRSSWSAAATASRQQHGQHGLQASVSGHAVLNVLNPTSGSRLNTPAASARRCKEVAQPQIRATVPGFGGSSPGHQSLPQLPPVLSFEVVYHTESCSLEPAMLLRCTSLESQENNTNYKLEAAHLSRRPAAASARLAPPAAAAPWPAAGAAAPRQQQSLVHPLPRFPCRPPAPPLPPAPPCRLRGSIGTFQDCSFNFALWLACVSEPCSDGALRPACPDRTHQWRQTLGCVAAIDAPPKHST